MLSDVYLIQRTQFSSTCTRSNFQSQVKQKLVIEGFARPIFTCNGLIDVLKNSSKERSADEVIDGIRTDSSYARTICETETRGDGTCT